MDRLSYCTRLKNERAGEMLRLEFMEKIRAVKSPSGRRAKVRFAFSATDSVGGTRNVREVIRSSAWPDQ